MPIFDDSWSRADGRLTEAVTQLGARQDRMERTFTDALKDRAEKLDDQRREIHVRLDEQQERTTEALQAHSAAIAGAIGGAKALAFFGTISGAFGAALGVGQKIMSVFTGTGHHS